MDKVPLYVLLNKVKCNCNYEIKLGEILKVFFRFIASSLRLLRYHIQIDIWHSEITEKLSKGQSKRFVCVSERRHCRTGGRCHIGLCAQGGIPDISVGRPLPSNYIHNAFYTYQEGPI